MVLEEASVAAAVCPLGWLSVPWVNVCVRHLCLCVGLSAPHNRQAFLQAGAVLEDLLLFLQSFMLSEEFLGFLQG